MRLGKNLSSVRRIRKAAADKDRARKQGEAMKKAEAVEADKKQALAADMRRRALAAVVERQNHQKAQQLDAHRRQTDQMRTLHRAETQSHRDNEAVAVERHAQDIRRIDNTEREALDALSVQRGSLIGRSVALIKGKAHYDRKADAIAERCEATRMSKHRELEALKERQFSAAQQARLRQAHERKGIFEFTALTGSSWHRPTTVGVKRRSVPMNVLSSAQRDVRNRSDRSRSRPQTVTISSLPCRWPSAPQPH